MRNEDQTTKPVILLSGPVGAGKSTVVQELAASATVPTACIEGDAFWSFIVKSDADQGVQQKFKTIMRAMTAAALPYALTGYEVILDFSIPPWFLETACKIVRSREIPLDYIVLLPSEAVCVKRAATRTEGAINDYAAYHDFYLTFQDAEPRSIIQDDISDVKTIAAKIRDGLSEGKFRVAGQIAQNVE